MPTPSDMTPEVAFDCLCKDMEMLRNDDWVPDDDSIDAHLELLEWLYARIPLHVFPNNTHTP